MGIKVREQIKKILAEQNITMKAIAKELEIKLGKPCSPANLSSKLIRGTLTYNEVVLICDILGYDIEIKSREKL